MVDKYYFFIEGKISLKHLEFLGIIVTFLSVFEPQPVRVKLGWNIFEQFVTKSLLPLCIFSPKEVPIKFQWLFVSFQYKMDSLKKYISSC